MLTDLHFRIPEGDTRFIPGPNDGKLLTFFFNKDHEQFKGIWKDKEPVLAAALQIHEPGIYETNSYNFETIIENLTFMKQVDKHYQLFVGKDGRAFAPSLGDWEKIHCSVYGVADNIEQIKERFEPIIYLEEHQFVISFVRLQKKNETERGWRWHKWGEYIGTQKPQCEYLYNEPEIEEVLVYHGHYLTCQ